MLDTKKCLLVPKLTANDESVKITKWLAEDKSYIKSGQEILLVETSKTSIVIESESDGYIYINKNCKLDDIVAVGECYAYLFPALTDLEAYQSSTESNNDIVQNIIENNAPTFSKAALKFINEHKLNHEDFSGLGLVTIEKIKEKLHQTVQTTSLVNKEYFPQASIEKLPFSKLSEINNLKKPSDGSIVSSLSVQFNSESIRNKIATVPWLNRRLLPYILHVFAKLLAHNPRFTSFYLDQQICMYNRINIGLAIDLGKGLKVVVINDVDKLSLFDLQMNIVEAITHYHEDSLTLLMLQNSTAMVTDLSQDDIFYFQPVLHTNHTIVLGIGGDQKIAGAPMTLTIAFDHRVLSGQEVAIFLKTLKEKLLTEIHEL